MKFLWGKLLWFSRAIADPQRVHGVTCKGRERQVGYGVQQSSKGWFQSAHEVFQPTISCMFQLGVQYAGTELAFPPYYF